MGLAEQLSHMKPRVLFITEKWIDGDPRNYESPYEACLIGPLEAYGTGEAVCFYYDEFWSDIAFPTEKNREALEVAIEKKIKEAAPDLIIVTHILQWQTKTARPEFWANVVRHVGVPVVPVWVESSPDVIREAERFRPHVSFSVVTCHPTLHLKYTQDPEHYLFAVEPRDPRVFNDDFRIDNPYITEGAREETIRGLRNIPISFIGTTLRRQDRIVLLANLWANGVPVFKAGGKEGGNLTTPEYADLLRRSKMTISTTADGFGVHRYTGRATEAMLCGAMLFESANDLTSRDFVPMRDYVPFDDPVDLIKKYLWYSEHDGERRKIAESGMRAAREKRTGKVFWTKVLERAGIRT